MNHTIIKPCYELIMYDQRKFSKDSITKEAFYSMAKEDVDHIMAIDFGFWGFRTADGQRIERDLSEFTIGHVSLKVLEAVQCEPGDYFSPADMAELTGIATLREPNNLAACWRRLRLSLHETFHKPNFLLSKRTGGYGVAWNPDRSFIQITRIAHNTSRENK